MNARQKSGVGFICSLDGRACRGAFNGWRLLLNSGRCVFDSLGVGSC